MPPRKSVGRQVGATPARSSSSMISAIQNESPQVRRSTRQATVARSQVSGESGGRLAARSVSKQPLPDLQNQQSYAYGANKGSKMPNALGTAGKQSLQDMAGHIEEEFEEEEDDEDDDDREVESESDEASVASEVPEESQREESREPERLNERNEGQDVDQSSDISQPSQFPSGLMDHSYNYERGIRRIRTINIRARASQPFTPIKNISRGTRDGVSRLATLVSRVSEQLRSCLTRSLSQAWSATSDILASMLQYLRKLPVTSIFAVMAILFGLVLGLGMFGATICFFYQRIGCAALPTTGLGGSLHTGFSTICGDCATAATAVDFSSLSTGDIAQVTSTLANINRKVQDLERRLNYRIDSNQATLASDLQTLKQQQLALSNHLADHVDQTVGTSGHVASPLIPKINFFAPWNGVLVDPNKSTPTKEIQLSVLSRFWKKFGGMERHYANGPTAALTSWQDYGDCWCAADQLHSTQFGQDFVRLVVSTNEMIYPTELVIEHFPSAGNLDREATPRKIELWADFSHLDDDQWQQMKLEDMQKGNVLGPNWARIGKMTYDVSRSSHIQTAMLDVNQYGLLHAAQNFALRVTANYGGKNVCLYRVRLHGQPVAAPEAGNTQEWLERMGYRAEVD
ncbi:uncharacterized protein AB675_4547 [Cyphellophora attinorum]|uniref:SUN domain-containing protein n=1 Tax=Cyphellophora attinorum TaxID=1664694 RepID=A0A0N1NYH1_9EURO|nr:uncharacterized protein AB675_4547 [Phialophora attinorum]KPI38925.1 hypothetical protein AB675_4547 [Phialophora attinorum]